IIKQKVKVDQKVRILELKQKNYEEHCSDILYAVSIKEDMVYLCPKLHSASTKRRFYTPYPEDIHTPYSSTSLGIFWIIIIVEPTTRNPNTLY
ncbi:hypothetical protein Tco_1297502, partial [Tanacetum coccineum]